MVSKIYNEKSIVRLACQKSFCFIRTAFQAELFMKLFILPVVSDSTEAFEINFVGETLENKNLIFMFLNTNERYMFFAFRNLLFIPLVLNKL